MFSFSFQSSVIYQIFLFNDFFSFIHTDKSYKCKQTNKSSLNLKMIKQIYILYMTTQSVNVAYLNFISIHRNTDKKTDN